MKRCIREVKSEGKTIGLVPTMGWLHEGHLSLMRRAKHENDFVVVSIFVNPTQFGPGEDYRRYPRDLRRDQRLSEEVGVDVLFVPAAKEMYPERYLTYVQVNKITEVLCGISRPGHFRGVTTVCTKLFNIISSDVAYFGQKDAQQAVVIKKMVRDLNMPVKIKVMPTVRERDGLAMSSRNTYLSDAERRDALVVYQSLQNAHNMIKLGQRDSKKIVSAMKKMIAEEKRAKAEYIEIVDAESLARLERVSGQVLIALAVWIGKTRLIDNIIIRSGG